MATKLAIGFFLKSTKEMSKDDMPHDGSETLFGLDEAGTASKLYRRHRLLAETRRDIRQMTVCQVSNCAEASLPFFGDTHRCASLRHVDPLPVSGSTGRVLHAR